jgi:enoyl-CoA hydratase
VAKELVLSGDDRVPADRALRTGLVNRVVPREMLEPATLALAEEIAKNEPLVVRQMKASINRAWEVAGMAEALEANVRLDVEIETANLPARDEFRRITQERGLKAAIAWRDARYRGGE